jgi:hypothetical protein
MNDSKDESAVDRQQFSRRPNAIFFDANSWPLTAGSTEAPPRETALPCCESQLSRSLKSDDMARFLGGGDS